jgi:hypothetical protein
MILVKTNHPCLRVGRHIRYVLHTPFRIVYNKILVGLSFLSILSVVLLIFYTFKATIACYSFTSLILSFAYRIYHTLQMGNNGNYNVNSGDDNNTENLQTPPSMLEQLLIVQNQLSTNHGADATCTA